MNTRLILTGTGIPAPLDGRRAGAGAMVIVDDLVLQFDVGRATTLRIAALGLACTDISAVFLTHHHSDHLIGLDDLVMTRWFDEPGPRGALPIICPAGPCVRFCERMLERWDDDLTVRQANEHQTSLPQVTIAAFPAPSRPSEVWHQDDVVVSSVAVHHEPVKPSVAYRIDTPSGSVAISGDTRICDEFAELAKGADLVVHEALSRELLPSGPEWDPIVEYYAEAEELGRFAAALAAPVLLLTHLCPPPLTIRQEAIYADAVRRGGFTGQLVVGRDLDTVHLSASGLRIEQRSDEAAQAE
jgi:ribonuclease Z